MKIEFEDKSFVQITKNSMGNIVIMIQAKDHENSLKKISNAVELSPEEFKRLIGDL